MERLVDPLTTTDAKLWADEFMKVKARLGEQKFDHAMMLAWFANAIMQGYDEGRRRAKADAQATVEALQAQVKELEGNRVPHSMQHVIELQAMNDRLEQQVEALQREREKVKTLEEQLRLANCDQANTEADLNDVTAQLATLQALVRAISETMEPFRKSLAKLDEVDTLATRRIAEADAYYCAQRALATLDATTPDSNQLGDINDMVSKGGNGE